jgi:hypothetical protein
MQVKFSDNFALGRSGLVGGAALAVVAAFFCFKPAPTESDLSADLPAAVEIAGESGFSLRRKAWLESLHRADPGLNWRLQDSAFREAREIARVRERSDPRAFAKSFSGALGLWVERGSSNLAGRVSAFVPGQDKNLFVLSDAGNVLQANRLQLDWKVLNEAKRFENYGHMVRFANGGERLLIASDDPSGVFYSDSSGQNWTPSVDAAPVLNRWYSSGLSIRAGSDDVYLLRVEYDFTAPAAWKPKLSVSSDRGATFQAREFIGVRNQVALFSPPYDASTSYLLSGNQLFSIERGTHALNLLSTVPSAAVLAASDMVALSGGVENGKVFLYAFFSMTAEKKTLVFRSLDGGLSWAERETIPQRLMRQTSAESSTLDPARAYAGGVNLYRTEDGAASWLRVNNWEEYYDAPLTKLHADITNVDVIRSDANELVYLSTDGGLYESTDGAASVKNLSLRGMNVSQYYSSFTQRQAPHRILLGSQDQGYQKLLQPKMGINDFVQTISGDYDQLASADGGNSVWMIYPGFVLYESETASLSTRGLKWRFSDHKFSANLFLPPMALNPANGSQVLVGGGSFSASGNQLASLTLTDSAITHSEVAFNFGAFITALAYSKDGTMRYAVNDKGRFFRQVGSEEWQAYGIGFQTSAFFRVKKIIEHPLAPNVIFVAGSGYSNPPVFRSTDGGLSFSIFSTGLPRTLVYDLAISENGKHIFAATELGPYYFDAANSTWQDIGSGAPAQAFTDVDFVDAEQIARFSTYGRGLWDFELKPDSAWNLTGHWAIPSENGWGLTIAEQGEKIFPNWFTFGTDGKPLWLSMPGMSAQEDGSYLGELYDFTGKPFDQINGTQAFNSFKITGKAKIRALSESKISFSYMVNDVAQSKILERLSFAESTACISTPLAAIAANPNFTDVWHNSAESGWGVHLTHQKNTIFGLWYTYSPNGQNQWITAIAQADASGKVFTGKLFRAAQGAPFGLQSANTPASNFSDVGNIRFEFSDGATLRMSYTLDGISQSKLMTRFQFGATASSCRRS